MAINNPYKSYQQNSVVQLSPAELTLMLYNGCLKFLNQAKKGIESGNIELKNINIQKAQNIISEFMITLDMSVPLSKNMMSLYEYMHHQLVQANIHSNVELIDEVSGLITDFRDTWKQAIQINRQKQYGQTGEI